MQSFQEYLISIGAAKSTVKQHLYNLNHFKLWCEAENLVDIETLTYRDFLGYIQQKKTSPQTMNLRLNSLTKYYDYLMEADLRQENPVRRLRVKTMKARVMPDLLKQEELIDLLESFKAQAEFREPKHRDIHQRNYLILSLIVYQAIDMTTLKRLRVGDLDFEKGMIYFPATKRSNDRDLKLHASQIIPFHTYVLQTRTKLEPKGQELFSCQLNNTLTYILKKVKAHNPSIRNIGQIRASVISSWLKRNQLRRVQYMAGHRYISSTEKYEQQDIEHLQESLSKFHPLG